MATEMAETVRGLQTKLRETLESLVPIGGDVALLDFPNHNNSGDSAIWLGELRFLKERGAQVRYVCDEATYDSSDLKRSLPEDGVILLHGGGNFGDLWPLHHDFRLSVVKDFPERSFIQLPQTIRVAEPTAGAWKPRVTGNGNLTVLCRDRLSLLLAQSIPNAQIALAPDMALMLGRLDRLSAPDREVVWITRGDKERRFEALHHAADRSVLVTDWLALSGYRRIVRPVTVRTRGVVSRAARSSRGRRNLMPLRRAAAAPHEALARRRVRNAVRLLSRGRVVVTDRLHGHIFCLLLGIPHVLLEDAGGKIRGFVDAFATDVPGVEWATCPEDALSRARELVSAT